MSKMVLAASATLLVLLSLTAAGAPLYFGEYAPLTNTRYGGQPGVPQLVATNKDLLLVWPSMTNVRVVRLIDGERRTSQVVMKAFQRDAAAVWTGRHVLVAATYDGFSNALMGRLVDAGGTPTGEVFQIQAGAFRPRMASNGSRILLLYQRGTSAHASVLSIDGKQVLADFVLAQNVDRYDIASNGTGFTAVVSSQAAVRVFTFDANGLVISTTTVAGARTTTQPRDVAVASDDDDYLAVWNDAAAISAAGVTKSGTATVAMALESTATLTATGGVDVVWAGDHYEVAYRAFSDVAEIRLLNVRSGAPAVQRISNVASTTTSDPSLAHVNGRTRVAWNAPGGGLIRVRDTSATGEGEVASFGASEQNVMAAATTTDSAMFVWYELADDTMQTRIGFRDRLGSWIERSIGTNLERTAIAATNGTDFMVVTADSRDWLAYRINANGTVQGQPSRIATRASVLSFNDMTWNGRSYVLAGVDKPGGRIIAATLSTGGIMNPPVVVREPLTGFSLDKPAVASDGTNTLIAWSEVKTVLCFPVCDMAIDGINARLLGPDLQLLGESPLMIVDNDAGPPQVVWSTEYAILWLEAPANTGRSSVRAQRMGRDGKRAGPAFTMVPDRAHFNLEAIGMRTGFALTWAEGAATGGIRETWVAIARPDGTIAYSTAVPKQQTNSALLALLPDERVAHAIAVPQIEAPHHGASRIVLAVADVIPPRPLPGAPRLSVHATSSTAELSWTPPAGAVNGYRLEYRVGDGAWIELDRFHGPEQTTASIRLSGNRIVSFRVRAFNDSGAGPYSNTGGVGGGKRRSVR